MIKNIIITFFIMFIITNCNSKEDLKKITINKHEDKQMSNRTSIKNNAKDTMKKNILDIKNNILNRNYDALVKYISLEDEDTELISVYKKNNLSLAQLLKNAKTKESKEKIIKKNIEFIFTEDIKNAFKILDYKRLEKSKKIERNYETKNKKMENSIILSEDTLDFIFIVEDKKTKNQIQKNKINNDKISVFDGNPEEEGVENKYFQFHLDKNGMLKLIKTGIAG